MTVLNLVKNLVVNPAMESYIDYLMRLRQDQWDQIKLLREYADGDQRDVLTDKQKELLVGPEGADPEFHMNICKPVLTAETDRLKVQGIEIKREKKEEEIEEKVPEKITLSPGSTMMFPGKETINTSESSDSPEDGSKENQNPLEQQEQKDPEEEENARLTRLAKKWWSRSKMDEGQLGLHYSGCRDGDSFTLSVWNEKRKYPQIHVNQAYDGESAGVEIFYKDGEPTEVLFAVKIWTLERPTINNADYGRTRRKNVYYEDRIEYYITETAMTNDYQSAGWRPLAPTDPDWDDRLVENFVVRDAYGNEYVATVFQYTVDGEPMGIPVSHYRRAALGDSHGRSAIAEIVPGIQDAVNRSSLAVMAGSMLSGFKVVWATKFDPKRNEFKVYPGAIIYNIDDGSFGQFAETDLMQLIAVKDGFVKDAAMITMTPLNFFTLSGDVPAAGTLRQLESGLLTKIEKNQISFGNGHEETIRNCFKLELAYGTEMEGYTLEEIENLEITTVWNSANIRDERLDAEIAKAHSDLDVPEEEVWRKLGYAEDKIAEFKIKAEKKRLEQQQMFERQQLQDDENNGPGRPTVPSEKEKQEGTNSAIGKRSMSTG